MRTQEIYNETLDEKSNYTELEYYAGYNEKGNETIAGGWTLQPITNLGTIRCDQILQHRI